MAHPAPAPTAPPLSPCPLAACIPPGGSPCAACRTRACCPVQGQLPESPAVQPWAAGPLCALVSNPPPPPTPRADPHMVSGARCSRSAAEALCCCCLALAALASRFPGADLLPVSFQTQHSGLPSPELSSLSPPCCWQQSSHSPHAACLQRSPGGPAGPASRATGWSRAGQGGQGGAAGPGCPSRSRATEVSGPASGRSVGPQRVHITPGAVEPRAGPCWES